MSQNTVITVPDVSAEELTASVESALGVRFGAQRYHWDFYRRLDGTPISGRGKRFEVCEAVIPPTSGKKISVGGVRRYFSGRGNFIGHVGAFLWWHRTYNKEGCFLTIPERDACYLNAFKRYCMPKAFNEGMVYGLGLDGFGEDEEEECLWVDDWTFVGFRELP